MSVAPGLAGGGTGLLTGLHEWKDEGMNVWLSEDGTRLVCNAFALCDRPAEWATPGPVGNGEMGMVPVCQRCADRLGMTDLRPYEVEVEA